MSPDSTHLCESGSGGSAFACSQTSRHSHSQSLLVLCSSISPPIKHYSFVQRENEAVSAEVRVPVSEGERDESESESGGEGEREGGFIDQTETERCS